MGDQYYFWFAFFALQGIVADILILFGIVFLLIVWLAFKVEQMRRAQQARRNKQANGDIMAQINKIVARHLEDQ